MGRLLARPYEPTTSKRKSGPWTASSDRWNVSPAIAHLRTEDGKTIYFPEALSPYGRWNLDGNTAWAILMAKGYGHMPTGVEFFFALNDLIREWSHGSPLLFGENILRKRTLVSVIRRIEKARLSSWNEEEGRDWDHNYRYQLVRVEFTKKEGVRFIPDRAVPVELYLPKKLWHSCTRECCGLNGTKWSRAEESAVS